MPRTSRVLFLLAVLLGAVSEVRQEGPLTHEEIIRRWSDGPVRYLMTRRELDAVDGLRTVPELARFITQFWERRDPSAGTALNEMRREYWQRVLETNRRFRDSTVPGWRTDRGKVFILLGEPEEVRVDEHPAIAYGLSRSNEPSGPAAAGRRGVERWTYKRKLSRLTDPEFVVVFVRDESLDWKLSSDPDLLEPTFSSSPTGSTTPGLDGRNPGFGGSARVSAQSAVRVGGAEPGIAARLLSAADATPQTVIPPFDTSVFAAYDLGLEMSVPSSAEEILAVVSTREFVSGLPVAFKVEFFRAQDGSTFVNVGGQVSATNLYGPLREGFTTLRAYASLDPSGAGGRAYQASNEGRPAVFDLSRDVDPSGQLCAWTGLAVPPGRYLVTVAVEDSLTGRLGRASAEIEVPDLAGRPLGLSSLVLATSLHEEHGQLGAESRSSGVFRRSETFAVYFEVYGPRSKTLDGVFDVFYSFYRTTTAGPEPIGEPIAMKGRNRAAQGWSFPLAGWPAGRYEIEVRVTDGSGRSAAARAPFEVIE